MSGLPRTILGLDPNLEVRVRYTRLEPESELLKKLAEKDYDRLIAQHKDVIEELLLEAVSSKRRSNTWAGRSPASMSCLPK
jgi:hypothetical protein